MTLFYGDLLPYVSELLGGLWVSVYAAVLAMFIGGLIGVGIYLGKGSRITALSAFCKGYIGAFRNTPLLVQLYIIYFGLPQLGVNFSPIWCALIGLTLNNAAYTAEIYRGGFEAVPNGLREAGRALGMSSRQVFVHVMFAPAVRNVFPALTNQFILLFLATSVASIISLPELTHVMLDINSVTYRTFEVITVAGGMYFVASTILTLASRFANARLFRWAGTSRA